MAYGMVINLKKCVGCWACSTSCKAVNGTPPGILRSRVERVRKGKYPDVIRTITPRQCMHCEKPPCLDVCPVEGATYKCDDGVVVIDKDKCIGCKACIEACPYDARNYIENSKGYFGDELNAYETVMYANMPSGTVDKCDFCKGNGRLKAGEPPACVQACVAKARIFGDLDDLKKIIEERNARQLLPEQGTNPSIYYIGAE